MMKSRENVENPIFSWHISGILSQINSIENPIRLPLITYIWFLSLLDKISFRKLEQIFLLLDFWQPPVQSASTGKPTVVASS